jgi:hypothetical protein
VLGSSRTLGGLISARCDRDVYCGCKLNVVVMEADVPAELVLSVVLMLN